MDLISKIRYKYYSKYYKEIPKDLVSKINKSTIRFFARANGKKKLQ